MAILNQRGFGFFSVLVALLLAAALYFGYFRMQSTHSERAVSITAIDASRVVACRTQRQNIEREIMMWSVNHPDEEPTMGGLQAAGVRIASCPEGGQYSLVGRHVECSKHQ